MFFRIINNPYNETTNPKETQWKIENSTLIEITLTRFKRRDPTTWTTSTI